MSAYVIVTLRCSFGITYGVVFCAGCVPACKLVFEASDDGRQGSAASVDCEM
jgi:hypothetical protein